MPNNFTIVEKKIKDQTIIGIKITEGPYTNLVFQFNNIQIDVTGKVDYEFRILDKPSSMSDSFVYSPDLDQLLKEIFCVMLKTVMQDEITDGN